jgi:hypothetical protein
LRVQTSISLKPGCRFFLLDLDSVREQKPHLLASACKALLSEERRNHLIYTVEGVGNTSAIMLLESPKSPRQVLLDGKRLENFEYSAKERLLWLRFENEVTPRKLTVEF